MERQQPTQNEIRGTAIILLIATTSSIILVNNCFNVYGSTLEKETLPLNTTGSPIPMNATADAEDIDISVDPTEDISSPNGTQSISTQGATDLDINDFPPVGVTVVIENETVSVTENPVTIGEPINAQIQEQAPAAIQDEIEDSEE